MAFRNSLKVTLLSLESEPPPRSYPAQPAFLFEEPGFEEPPFEQPDFDEPAVEEPAARAPERVAAPTLVAVPTPRKEIEPITAAAMWQARADALRAMTDTLPSAITRRLMPKIIALYDGFAREEGWSDTPIDQAEPTAPRPEDEPLPEEPLAEEPRWEEFPEDDTTLALVPPLPESPAFARRPLPSSRRGSMRR